MSTPPPPRGLGRLASTWRREGHIPAAAPRLGRWRLGPPIGEGTGSQVFQAWDVDSGAEAAIKRIALPAGVPRAWRREAFARLHRELELSARLAHADTLRMFGVGLEGDCAWLACERVHGGNLARYVEPARRLPDALALRLLARIAAVLGHAHGLGIVHRDLKTANVLVDLPRDVVKVADFGAAHDARATITGSGVVVGTPECMAPEQLCGDPAAPPADAWALGVIAHELFVGSRPHRGETLGALLQAVTTAPAPALLERRPELPKPLGALVDPLLRRDPAERPADLGTWARQAAALAGVVERASRPDAVPRPGLAVSDAQ